VNILEKPSVLIANFLTKTTVLHLNGIKFLTDTVVKPARAGSQARFLVFVTSGTELPDAREAGP